MEGEEEEEEEVVRGFSVKIPISEPRRLATFLKPLFHASGFNSAHPAYRTF